MSTEPSNPIGRSSRKPQESRPGPVMYRCAGPNCGILKSESNRWWLMWTSYGEWGAPTLFLAPWSDDLAHREGTMPVCGEACAQKLQSQFMDNLIGTRSPTR